MYSCKKLQNLDIKDLKSQLLTATHCYKTIHSDYQHDCCLCGKKCKYYFIIYRKNKQKWKVAQKNDDISKSEKICVIGDCCVSIT